VLYRIRDDRADLMPLIAWAMEAHAASGGRPLGPASRASIQGPVGALVATPGRGERNGDAARPARPPRPAMARRPAPGLVSGAVPAPAVARPTEAPIPVPAAFEAPEPQPLRARRPNTELEDFLL
jgi:hypothetical protein